MRKIMNSSKLLIKIQRFKKHKNEGVRGLAVGLSWF